MGNRAQDGAMWGPETGKEKVWVPRPVLVRHSHEGANVGRGLEMIQVGAGSQDRWGPFGRKRSIRESAPGQPGRSWPSEVPSFPLKPVEELPPDGFATWSVCLFPSETCLSALWCPEV